MESVRFYYFLPKKKKMIGEFGVIDVGKDSMFELEEKRGRYVHSFPILFNEAVAFPEDGVLYGTEVFNNKWQSVYFSKSFKALYEYLISKLRADEVKKFNAYRKAQERISDFEKLYEESFPM